MGDEPSRAQEQALQQLVTRALEQADANGDHLIAALLSQCLVLIQDRHPTAH